MLSDILMDRTLFLLMGEQTEEERVSVMSKNIIDGLRYAYEAYCRGDIEGAVDAIDVDANRTQRVLRWWHLSGTPGSHLDCTHSTRPRVKSNLPI